MTIIIERIATITIILVMIQIQRKAMLSSMTEKMNTIVCMRIIKRNSFVRLL